jgi:hypothetical protein
MTGAFDRAMACRFAPFDGCERSTMMPHLFISAMTFLPRSLRPSPYRKSLVASLLFESASWLLPLCASDMYLPPRS